MVIKVTEMVTFAKGAVAGKVLREGQGVLERFLYLN